MKTIGLAVAVLLAAGPLFREYRPFRIERAGERAGVAAVDAGSYQTVPLLQFAMLDGGGMGAACACGSVHGFWEDGGTAVLTTTRTGVASCLPGAQSGFASGAMTFCGPNLPRVTTYGSLSSLGVLSEAASTNNLSYSDELDNGAAWATINLGAVAPTVTANYAAGLDGGLTAERIEFPAVAAGQYSMVWQNAGPIGANTYGSVFVKGTSGSGEICVELAGVTPGTTCAFNPNTWTRCVAGGTSTAAGLYIGMDQGGCPTAQGSAQDVLVEGAQNETSANGATSYIPTKNGTGTRGVETHKFAALPDAMNSGCVAATFIPQYNTYTGNWGPTVVHGANAAFIYGQGNGLRMFDGTNTLTRSLTWDGGVKRVVAQWSAADGGMTLCNTTDNLCTTSAYDGTMPVGGGALLDFCSAVQIGTFAGKAACTDLMVDYTPSRCQ